MKIYRPGLPVTYVDEPAPVRDVESEDDPLPSVAEAIKAADARQTQILEYTRAQQPVVGSDTPPAQPQTNTQDQLQAEIDRLLALQKANQSLQPGPHSISDKPEVDK
jgi:hypothetical protein